MSLAANGRRQEDQDYWARVSLFMERYRILLYLFMLGILALGFDFKTPRQYYEEFNGKLSGFDARLEAVEENHVGLNDKIDVLLKFRCLDQEITERERNLAGLNCASLVPNQTNGANP